MTARGPATGHDSRWDVTFRAGSDGERLLLAALGFAENDELHFEVKSSRFQDWSLFVEVAQAPRWKGQRNYKPSGLLTSRAEVWAFVKPFNTLLLVPRRTLLHAYESGRFPIRDGGVRGDNPTRGFLLPAHLLVGAPPARCNDCAKRMEGAA